MRFLLPALLLSSCATIVNSSGFKTVEVTSVPPGARFSSDSAGVAGVTPAFVQMPNGRPITLDFSLPDHEPLRYVARPRLSGWVAGNLLFGGLIGIVVDAINSNGKVHGRVSVNLLPVAIEDAIEPASEQPHPE